MKMKYKNVIFSLLITLGASPSAAQHQWTLDECVQYAKEHNTEVKRRLLAIQMDQNELNTAKHDWLPTVQARAGQQFSFGNALASAGYMPSSASPFREDLSYTSAAVSLEMPLFDGFRTRNRIRAARWSVRYATAMLEHARKDLSIQVANHYLQALYEQGMMQIAQSQVDISRQLCERARKLVNEGKNPKSDIAEAEAQLAACEYELTENRGRWRMAMLALAQLLNQPSVDAFHIADVTLADSTFTATADSVANRADAVDSIADWADIVERNPAVTAGKALVERSRYNIGMARADYFPQVTLRAALNTYSLNFFHQQEQDARQRMWLIGYDNKGLIIAPFDNLLSPKYNQNGFARQLWDNRSELLGLHLTVPIFDHFRTRNKIRKAKMLMTDYQLALDDTRQRLYREIAQAHYAAVNARERYQAAKKAKQSSQTSFNLERIKYEAGRTTLYDFNQATQRLKKASEDELQAKYEWAIRQKIIEFYSE